MWDFTVNSMTGKRNLVLTMTAVYAFFALSAAVTAQRYRSLEAFRASTTTDKIEILNSLRNDSAILPDQLRDIVLVGLADTTPTVRESAVRAITARIGNPPFDRTTWQAVELPILQAMGPQLARSLDDANTQVRRSTIDAIASLELDLSRPAKAMADLRPATAKLLANRYLREPDGLTRYRIVNVFAWFAIQPSIQQDTMSVLSAAISDSSPAVLQAALLGVGTHHIVALLPKVARLLEHDNLALRISAAQAMGTLGRDAAAYRGQIQAAFDREPDHRVKIALSNALTRIDQ
jgi:HEAT repeat protein